MSVSVVQAAFVRDLVYKHAAIVLDSSKDYLLVSRLEPVASKSGYRTIGELVDAARGATQIQNEIIDALTTNETLFFRDIAPFECLKKHVLPELVKRKNGGQITIWSAACSTGQEPYSIAMTLLDEYPDAARMFRIVATDISERTLTQARSGTYKQLELNRGLPARNLLKYFDQKGLSWQAKPVLRSLIEFWPFNLNSSFPGHLKPDVIFMRNVLIYFDVPTKRKILERAARSISSRGSLFLGAGESIASVTTGWEPISIEKTTYYKAL